MGVVPSIPIESRVSSFVLSLFSELSNTASGRFAIGLLSGKASDFTDHGNTHAGGSGTRDTPSNRREVGRRLPHRAARFKKFAMNRWVIRLRKPIRKSRASSLSPLGHSSHSYQVTVSCSQCSQSAGAPVGPGGETAKSPGRDGTRRDGKT